MKQAVAGKKAVHRGEPVILFGVGDFMFAIAAAAVEEIRNTEGLQQCGISGDLHVPKVQFLLKRDGRTYYIVDANRYFQIPPAHATRVLVLRNSRAALLVSHIDRMTEISNVLPLPRAFRGEERAWYRGLTVLDTADEIPVVVPLVRPESILTTAELQMLGAGESRKEQMTASRVHEANVGVTQT